MRPIIEFCSSNMHHGTDRVMAELEANPEYDVIEYGCLGNCGECAVQPFALLNGDTLLAETAEELQEQLLQKIREAEEMERLLSDEPD
ncbi:YuzB family protein [Gorillibacterium timonense]|uniref:YuzB family protein n=1 Tax=Gorillibacterium timonense TaxID=1689269 RepID=UPI00071E29D2|nr:YuzB family protein [Gorillibacterium timonense]